MHVVLFYSCTKFRVVDLIMVNMAPIEHTKTNASYVLGILSPNPMATRLGLAWGMVTAKLNKRLL